MGAARLEGAQQLGLQGQGQLGHLVEEHRAPPGGLQQPGLFPLAAGEGAPLVAEQLALEQAVGDRRAVDAHERLPGPAGRLVDDLGQVLLADPGFADDQHRQPARGEILGLAVEALHLGSSTMRRTVGGSGRPGQGNEVGHGVLIRWDTGPARICCARPAERISAPAASVTSIRLATSRSRLSSSPDSSFRRARSAGPQVAQQGLAGPLQPAQGGRPVDALQGAELFEAEAVDVALPQQVLVGGGQRVQALAQGRREGRAVARLEERELPVAAVRAAGRPAPRRRWRARAPRGPR